jgi:hypothetical protein
VERVAVNLPPEVGSPSQTEIIREILSAIEGHSRFLVSRRARLRRQFAAAGLARCMALLDGMRLLREGGRLDTMGVLLRSLFEAWLVAIYLLLKAKDPDDDSALIELGSDYARWAGLMAEKIGMAEMKAHVDDWKETIEGHPGNVPGDPAKSGLRGKTLSIEQLAFAVDSLLKERQGTSHDVMEIYNRVYRGESLYSAHPGVGTFNRYIDFDPAEESDKLNLRPQPPFPNQDRLAAMLTVDLALRIFKEFGIVVDPSLEAAYNGLVNREKQKAAADGAIEAAADVSAGAEEATAAARGAPVVATSKG